MKAKNASNGNLKVTWFGHSAFSFESPKGKIILTDPWLDNPKAPAGTKEIPKVDLILVSHGHSDHLGNTIEIARRTNAKVISIFEIYLYLTSQGITTAQDMNKGGTIDVDSIKISMVDAKHSSDIDVDGKVLPGGQAAGFVIEFENGFTVYFAGDTNLFGDMKYIHELHKLDAAFLPIGGHYTMAPREAALACKMLNPKYIVGMHYGTYPILSGTPSELKKYLPAKMKKRVIELEPGKTIALK